MNSFSLNLAYLKKHAKSRLKLIKSGSNKDLSWLLSQHPNQTLFPEQVKLSDIHLAIARELGLKSWQKLLSHIELLERHKSNGNEPLPPLDNDIPTLHVRCGHDIQQTLTKAGFAGNFLPYIEPLCIGPLALQEDEFLKLRADYVCHRLVSEIAEMDKSVEQVKREAIKETKELLSNDYQRVVLWIEHDNYDQLMLIRVLYLLSYSNFSKIEIIEVNRFPGREKFIGLGQLPPEALRSLWAKRKKVTIEQITTATQLWKAFCSDGPLDLIESYHNVDNTLFPNIHSVIFRHLQELPQVDSGLSLVESIVLDILRKNKEALEFSKLFKRYMELEPLVYLGDVMFWVLIKPLTEGASPLLTVSMPEPYDWRNCTLQLSDSNFSQRRIIEDKWVGGIHITQKNSWCWDHKNLSTISKLS